MRGNSKTSSSALSSVLKSKRIASFLPLQTCSRGVQLEEHQLLPISPATSGGRFAREREGPGDVVLQGEWSPFKCPGPAVGTLHSRRHFADMISLRIWRWGDYPRLLGGGHWQCNYQGSDKHKRGQKRRPGWYLVRRMLPAEADCEDGGRRGGRGVFHVVPDSVKFLWEPQALCLYSRSPQVPGKEEGKAVSMLERSRGSKVPPSLSIEDRKPRLSMTLSPRAEPVLSSHSPGVSAFGPWPSCGGPFREPSWVSDHREHWAWRNFMNSEEWPILLKWWQECF